MINPRFPFIWYGGDYNPDQWPEDIWKEDMHLLKKANINVVTLPVFSWAKLQPSEEKFDFSWLDKVLDMVYENGIHVCLATPTAAQPAWMSGKYPDILPVDEEGRKKLHGGRVNYCPNSIKYREFSANIASKMAERYCHHPAVALWHVSNEYLRYCYCDNCAAAFRKWLKNRYKTLENLNKCWNMSFWSHTVYDWEEIYPPSRINDDYYCFQSIALDYNRFMSDSNMELLIGESREIRRFSKNVPITTNFMGVFKPFDYSKWAEHLDVISWDSYPEFYEEMSSLAFKHDQMRGLKNGLPFMLMEQTPSTQNWQQYNTVKRPGVMRIQSYQAMAHGADTIMFFQMRRSIGACEKFHGAVIDHAGSEDTRIFRECTQLGSELKLLGDRIPGSRLEAKAAILFDWENWWAVELSCGPTKLLNYMEQIQKYYKSFYKRNIAVDVIRPDADLSRYDIVAAPVLYMVKEGISENLENFVNNGGSFITTFFSGIVDGNDLVTTEGYPGRLRNLMGIWVEETDPLYPDVRNSIIIERELGAVKGEYSCGMMCDILHLESAKSLGVYGSDFYKGRPVITENIYGRGKAYYIGSDPEQGFIDDLIGFLCEEKSLNCPIDAPEGVEIVQRHKEGKTYTFILNHNNVNTAVNTGDDERLDLISSAPVQGTLELGPKGVAILEK